MRGGRPRLGRAQQPEQLAHGQLVEFGQGAAPPFPAEGLRLQPRAMAGGAEIVGPEAGEEHPHVHLVGVLLQPAKEALHPVPVLRPLLALLGAVARLPVDDEGPLRVGEVGEGDVGGDLAALGEDPQVVLRTAVDLAFPAFDRPAGRWTATGRGSPGGSRFRSPARNPAAGAGPQRRVERKERRAGRPEGPAGLRGMQAPGEMARTGCNPAAPKNCTWPRP